MLQFLFELDGKILLFIQDHIRTEWLTPVMKVITHLGDEGMIWILLAAFLLCIKTYRKTGAAMAVALLIGYVMTNLILKNLIMRIRPYEVISALHALVEAPDQFSFPSGHATSAVAAGVIMFRTLPKYIGIAALVLTILICFSRLYVGVHYPTDVLVGVVIGLIAAFTARYIEKV